MNTIRRGDCIREMQKLEAGSVDLVFADPPFNIGYDYDVYRDSLSAEKYLDWSRKWIGGVHRILKPDGTFWLAIGDEFAAELKIESQKIGFHCRSWVIWYYTFGVNCSRKFTRSHAHLFHFVKDPDQFVFRADELENRVPSARQLVYNDGRANSRGRLPDDTWIIRPPDAIGEMTADDELSAIDLTPRDDDRTWVLRPQDLDQGFERDENTWYFPRVAGTFKERSGFHGCQMPEQLLGRIIRVCSEPDALVVDPFSGSGTTVAVAKKLGRRYLGFDLSNDYVRLGKERLKSIRVGDPLDGSAEPRVSAPKTDAPRTAKATRAAESNRQAIYDQDALAQLSEGQLRQMEEGVASAFARAHAGFSADRVVVDPQLNDRFLDACREKGIAGDPRTWNMLLFRLRKGGKLASIASTEQTKLDWRDCDPFLFASEIAWKLLLDEKLATGLDEILCDPELARRFDEIAASLAPGHSPLEYRWGALKLRKQSKTARVQAASLRPRIRFGQPVALNELEAGDAPDHPGVYLLGDARARRGKLYLGETINLRSRLRQQFHANRREFWDRQAHAAGISPRNLALWVRPIDADATEMLAWQSCLVQQHRPSLNLLNG